MVWLSGLILAQLLLTSHLFIARIPFCKAFSVHSVARPSPQSPYYYPQIASTCRAWEQYIANLQFNMVLLPRVVGIAIRIVTRNLIAILIVTRKRIAIFILNMPIIPILIAWAHKIVLIRRSHIFLNHIFLAQPFNSQAFQF
jgi:hypothetical protein